MAEEKSNVQQHILVSNHKVMTKDEVSKLLSNYNIKRNQLPLISIKDPAIENLECKEGDIIKIERKSQTAGTSMFYRLVI